MSDLATIFRTKLSPENQNQLLKFLSEMGNKATGPEKDALANMFTGLTSPNANMQQPNFFGGSLGWNALAPNANPSFFDKMMGYSQNGQNYAGWGMPVLQGIENIASAWQAYNQYKAGRDLQRDQFNLEKTKYNNAYDNLMEDRRIRAASRASANS